MLKYPSSTQWSLLLLSFPTPISPISSLTKVSTMSGALFLHITPRQNEFKYNIGKCTWEMIEVSSQTEALKWDSVLRQSFSEERSPGERYWNLALETQLFRAVPSHCNKAKSSSLLQVVQALGLRRLEQSVLQFWIGFWRYVRLVSRHLLVSSFNVSCSLTARSKSHSPGYSVPLRKYFGVLHVD